MIHPRYRLIPSNHTEEIMNTPISTGIKAIDKLTIGLHPSEKMRKLKKLARELDVPLVVTTQITRTMEDSEQTLDQLRVEMNFFAVVWYNF